MPLHVRTRGPARGGRSVEEKVCGAPRRRLQRADRVLFVIDAVETPPPRPFATSAARLPAMFRSPLVFNKLRSGGRACRRRHAHPPALHSRWSALTGQGLAGLRAHLKHCHGVPDGTEGRSAPPPHLEGPQRGAREHTEEAARQLTEHRAGELAAEELRAARSLEPRSRRGHQRGPSGADFRRVLRRKRTAADDTGARSCVRPQFAAMNTATSGAWTGKRPPTSITHSPSPRSCGRGPYRRRADYRGGPAATTLSRTPDHSCGAGPGPLEIRLLAVVAEVTDNKRLEQKTRKSSGRARRRSCRRPQTVKLAAKICNLRRPRLPFHPATGRLGAPARIFRLAKQVVDALARRESASRARLRPHLPRS